jgi:hypothetical protein
MNLMTSHFTVQLVRKGPNQHMFSRQDIFSSKMSVYFKRRFQNSGPVYGVATSQGRATDSCYVGIMTVKCKR